MAVFQSHGMRKTLIVKAMGSTFVMMSMQSYTQLIRYIVHIDILVSFVFDVDLFWPQKETSSYGWKYKTTFIGLPTDIIDCLFNAM